ncbi:hypothetical protein C0J52_02060 [Blattella germanica]|nr:hypothetical protein C0J52_02060 [Blattella germanica]
MSSDNTSEGFDDVKRETKPQGDQKYNIIDGYVDSATLESIAKAIPSSISDSPSYSSSVKKVASETQTSGNRAEKRKREDCPQCTERKKFKRSLKIKQLQLLNYKTKLDIINLERKLGIKSSIFENENMGLSEDWIITMDCVKVKSLD